MKFPTTRLAGMAVTAAAVVAIVLTQAAFAQEGEGDFATGTSKLIGRQAIRPNDDRFAPAAMAVINASSVASGARGILVFSKTMVKHAKDDTLIFHESVYRKLSRTAGGTDVRPLTNAEVAMLEALFVHTDLKRSRVSVSGEGIEGSVTARELGMKAGDLEAKAKALAERKAQMWGDAARSLPGGRG